MMQLYHDTIHAVCTKEYSPAQLEAWAPHTPGDREKFDRRFHNMYSIVAEENGIIVGYAGLMSNGEIDMVYTHKDHQGRGISSAIFAELEAEGRRRGMKRIIIDGSITATPYYKSRGYNVFSTKFKVNRGQPFTNYLFEKFL